jgi:hypothetical protein
MRVLTCVLLLAAMPLQAEEQTEHDWLAWANYQLAVAEAPGDARSDHGMAQLLKLLTWAAAARGDTPSEPMRSFQARAQVVTAELEARVDAARDGDPFLLAADLGCWPESRDMAACDHRRESLEPFAADNAFFGAVLMSNAWMREDAESFLRAARLAAGADVFDSLPAFDVRSAVERYRSVPMPPTLNIPASIRPYSAEFMATSGVIGLSLPVYQKFSQPCRESEGELRGYCLTIARMMLLQSQQLIEISIAASLVEAIGSPDDVALAKERQRETQWLVEKSVPLYVASEKAAVAGMDDYFEAYASEGEIAALRALLAANGIALLPPEDWTKSPTWPLANP